MTTKTVLVLCALLAVVIPSGVLSDPARLYEPPAVGGSGSSAQGGGFGGSSQGGLGGSVSSGFGGGGGFGGSYGSLLDNFGGRVPQSPYG
ncbi:keratin, type II cytoskeletal 68 kDa, component IB-like [Palaemon carinicauda]|uniref:keratin, type II cytoskeletal 68 kDa, component IB-like n=1 Tax=Palaemon carinicauda TaxID=392227 RepID=UPI0035B5F40D